MIRRHVVERLCPERFRGSPETPYHSTSSARCTAVKNWLRGDLIRGKLGLQMRAVFVKAGDDGKNDRGSEHQPGKKGKVLVGAKLVAAGTQDPFVDQGDEKFAGGDREKPQGHY